MKKIILLTLIVSSLSLDIFAQDTFIRDDKVFNLGVGIGSNLYTESGYSNTVPPIFASFEYCIKDELFDSYSSLGYGGFLGYASSEYEFNKFKADYSSVLIGGRGAFHYQFIDKLDTYIGIMLGYNIVSSSNNDDDALIPAGSVEDSEFLFDSYIGARYYFSNNLAVMGEIGYGIAYLKLGIAFKLN